MLSNVPKVSIICIALREIEFEPLRKKLADQTLQDFEFIGEVGGTIPEAWNRAIQRARGEILVFTETDAEFVYNTWLEELVNSLHNDKVIVKGLEISGHYWDLCNLACYRKALVEQNFDEDFLWAEDSEMFCRLKSLGYELHQVPVAPVIHLRKLRSKRLIRRAFLYGIYQARLRYRYGDSELVSGFDLAFKQLISYFLNLLGLCVGYLIYWPEFQKRARKQS